ncbi:hypothetical protein ACOSP7_013302 [Xanthoceras sorbifolium]
MASSHKIEVTIFVAKDLKNAKAVDEGRQGGRHMPSMGQVACYPSTRPVIEDTALCVDIVHAGDKKEFEETWKSSSGPIPKRRRKREQEGKKKGKENILKKKREREES